MDEKTEPIACTLDAEAQRQRGREFEDLARAALLERRRLEGALRLRYRRSEGVEAAVRDLVARERQCCSFLRFELNVAGDEIHLSISGPPEAAPILDAIFDTNA